MPTPEHLQFCEIVVTQKRGGVDGLVSFRDLKIENEKPMALFVGSMCLYVVCM